MIDIKRFDFDDDAPATIAGYKKKGKNIGDNWPIVYVINNKKEAYVGETLNASIRTKQHLSNADRRKLTEIRILSDETFNKSVILDLEAFLIKHMASDGKYTLQNGNNGIQDHEYYDKAKYEMTFRDVWTALKKAKVVKHTIDEIENSELFKYSPYKSLGSEQMAAEMRILEAFAEAKAIGGRTAITVRGGAGTGKTILGVYLLKLFADIMQSPLDVNIPLDDYYDENAEFAHAADSVSGIEKIGIVVPQASLKKSIKEVCKSVKNLAPSMVLSPYDLVKNYMETGKKYDLLIVDEAHRLKCRKHGHLSNYPNFDKPCQWLGLDKETSSELEFILMCSENQIMFRDELQTVRPCDMYADEFLATIEQRYARPHLELALDTQWRCAGGNEYIEYIKKMLSGQPQTKREFDNYDLKLFDDCDEMINAIKAKNDEFGLCRNVAGYAWPWASKNNKSAYDINIGDYHYRWNSTTANWINRPSSIDEIGCIHTVQGYDLNYVGVIIGDELKFDPDAQQIYADKDCYFDQQGKSGVADDPQALKEYLTNIYLTLMTRGIRGSYLYVCDEGLRKWVKEYVG